MEETLHLFMFREAPPLMKAYLSDLAHDAVALTGMRAGERYVWAVRESGTHLRMVPDDSNAETVLARLSPLVTILAAWEITVTRHGGGFPAGTTRKL